jgi:hypothetical protein
MLEGPDVQDAAKDMAAAITMDGPVGGRHMVLQTYLPRDTPIGEYHALVEKFRRVMDRQQWKDMLEAERETLANSELKLNAFTQTFNTIGERHAAEWQARGKKGDPKLGPREDAEKQNAKNGIMAGQEAIAKSKALIADLEAKLKAEPVDGG